MTPFDASDAVRASYVVRNEKYNIQKQTREYLRSVISQKYVDTVDMPVINGNCCRGHLEYDIVVWDEAILVYLALFRVLSFHYHVSNRGSQLCWSQDFLATCLLANIHIITIIVIEIKYDDDDDCSLCLSTFQIAAGGVLE